MAIRLIKLETMKHGLQKITVLALGILSLSVFSSPVKAETPAPPTESTSVFIEVFERADCKHCQDEMAFLEALEKEMPDLRITYYDVYTQEGEALWKELTELEGIPKVTPITLIGGTILQGFDHADTTGVMMESLIENARGEPQYSFRDYIDMGGGNAETIESSSCADGETCDPNHYEPLIVKIPLMGVTDVKRFSIPTLSLILGVIDGFNPCAMWVLVTFLIVLVQIGDRKRMIQVAGLFILAEAVMYFLILNVWFGLWDFIGLNNIVTPIVGILALGGGVFFLYEGIMTDGTCNVTNLKQRGRIRSKINGLVEAELTLLTIAGIVGLALSVNIIEFACSVGIPQAFTKILELNALTFLERMGAMLIYIFGYMVDDFLVFGIALYSIEKIGITHKYSRLTNVIGGLLMLVLGAILIINPELLVL